MNGEEVLQFIGNGLSVYNKSVAALDGVRNPPPPFSVPLEPRWARVDNVTVQVSISFLSPKQAEVVKGHTLC